MNIRRFTPRFLVVVSTLFIVTGALAWTQPGGPTNHLKGSHQETGALGNPSSLTGTAGANLQIELTWQSAANADTHWVYQVRADGIGSGSWHQGDGSLTVTGLENNVSYSFIVIATRMVDDDSEWSQWSNWVTVKAVLTLPNPPGRYEQISAGERHTCAIRQDQTVDCWGDNSMGQASPPEGQFRMVSAGGTHSCGISDDQKVVCWGAPEVANKTPDQTVLVVSAGDEHACAITTLDDNNQNKVICWGVQNATGRVNNRDSAVWVGVSAGKGHSCAFAQNRRVTCWGSAEHGQISGGSVDYSGAVIYVSAGLAHTCWLRANGAIGCQGNNVVGQTVTPSAEDEGASEEFYTYTEISAGGLHTCGLRSGGNIRCWGDNSFRQTAAPGDNDELRAEDPGVGDFISVSAGQFHTCALRHGGTAVCWGDNTYGQAPSWPR